MSTVQNPDQIIIIDDDVNNENTRVGQSKNTNFETSNGTNLRRNLENIKNEDTNNLARTFTIMLGALYGISSEDVNKMMESEKNLTTELYNAIEALSKVFKNSSNKETPKALQKDVTSFRNLEIPPNVSNISTNRTNNFFNVPIDKSKGETLTNRDTLVSPRITLINKEKPPVNLQRNDNVMMPMNIQRDINPISPSINEKEKSTTSGIKIGDNWELPIIVLDSDDDENEAEVIEVDSDEEEIKRMMSLDDFDCIEIGKDEFNKSKNGDNEVTDDDTDEEIFIPIVPGEGSTSKKRRHSYKLRPRPIKERRTTNCLDLSNEINDDPSKWRKDLLPFPVISNHLLRVWATGYLHYRAEWERLEYLGDKVLMFCVLRFATAKYLRFYTPSDIKLATTFLVSNKLLAAYSLTLGLNRQNQMQEGLNKRVADAFEAYIGAYYLSDGEEATTRYLEQLMSPLFELVLSNIQTGREPRKVMGVIAKYFQMTFLTRIPKLK